MSMGSLLLNCFPVELSPTRFDLPFVDYETWEASTKALEEDYAGFGAYRSKIDDRLIRVLLLDGPEFPSRLKLTTAEITALPHLGTKFIERSLSRYLTARGLVTSRDSFGTTKVLTRTPEFSQGLLQIFCGISYRVRRPFDEDPCGFTVSVQWEVSPTFGASLADPTLRGMSEGMAVLYKPSARPRKLPPDLRPFRNRYLGHVHEIRSEAEAVVSCKDGVSRHVPLADLVLEASSAAIREYENQAGRRYGSRSVWHKMQELNFVLNSGGRRNASVLKDRLRAIRQFLGGGSREQLVLPLCCFHDGFVSIALSPIRVEVA